VGWTTGSISFLDNPMLAAPVVHRLWTAASVQFRYLALQAAPVGLSSDYGYHQIPVVQSGADVRLLGFLLLVALAAGAAWVWRERHPIVAAAVGGYALLAAPVSNFLAPLAPIMAQRLAYAPSFCVCALLGYGVVHLGRRSRPGAIGATALCLALFLALALQQRRTWSAPGPFFRAQVHSAPNSARAHYGLGRHHHEAGRTDSARVHYLRAIEILPSYADAWNNLGLTWKDQGDLGSAVRAYGKALTHSPDDPRIHYNLGQAYHLDGNLEAAEACYLAAIELDSSHVEAHGNLGVVYAQTGRLSGARAQWTQALRHDPSYGPARLNLARMARSDRN